jgi:hypothetical protein
MATNQPITTGATTTTVSQGISGVRIRSPLGLLAALTFLLGIPISFGWQILFSSGAGTTFTSSSRRASYCLRSLFSISSYQSPVELLALRWLFPALPFSRGL